MHALFIDDTGTKEKEDPAADLFAYSGIIFDWEASNSIQKTVAGAKLKYLKNESAELKSRWFRMPDLRKEKYLIPFGLDDEAFRQFSTELFDLIASMPIHCLGAVVSKAKMKRTYTKVVFDPSPVAYELLLQRVANYLTQYRIFSLNIVFDDMSGKNPNGSEWKRLLIRQHKQLKLGKSPLYRTWTSRPGMNYSRIPDDIAFDDSSVNTFLQLADLCAYNVMRQARDYQTFDGDQMYSGYKWIHPIMHKDPDSGQVTSFGAVYFP
jgi:hypothetical protein